MDIFNLAAYFQKYELIVTKFFYCYNLGEKLTKEEAKGLMKELCDPADDDGFMPFKRKLIYHSANQLIFFPVITLLSLIESQTL